jgi:beta-ureidopropionase
MAGKFESLEKCLEKNVPEDELKEVKRILYGNPCRLVVIMYHLSCTMHGIYTTKELGKFMSLNCSLNSKLEFSQEVIEEANAKKVELAGYKIHAGPEQLRKPRIVRIGAVQNKIVLSTTAPVAEQVNCAVINADVSLYWPFLGASVFSH